MKHFLALLIFLAQFSYAQQVMFTAPDTVFVNDPVQVVNTSTNGTSYYWSFSANDMSGDPVLTTFAPQMQMNNTFMEIVREDTSFYGFSTYEGGGLLKYSFGNSLLNTPTVNDFGNLGGLVPPRPQGLQVLKDTDGWHILLTGGEDPQVETRVIRLDLGATLANNILSGVNWGNIADMASPIGLYIWKDMDSSRYYGYLTQHNKRSMVLADFGSSFNNPPAAHDVGELDDAFWPGGLTAVKRDGKYYLFVANEDNGWGVNYWINRINFGTNLLEPAASTYTDLFLPDSIGGPKDVTIFNDNGIERVYVPCLGYSSLVKFTFAGNNIAADSIVVDSVYYMETYNGPYSMSDFLSSGNDLVAFITNLWSLTLTRVVYPGGIGSSVNGSSQKDPAAFTYTTPGTYKIRLSMDEGLMTQQSIYKTIVVLPQPPVNPGGTRFKIYPNPTAGIFYLQLYSKLSQLQVYTVADLSGRVVYTRQFRITPGSHKLEVVLPRHLRDGVYLISNGNYTQKLVLKRH